MYEVAKHADDYGQAGTPHSRDKCAILPILACTYATIVGPLYDFAFAPVRTLQTLTDPGIPNRIFWPTIAVIAVIVAVQNASRLSWRAFPPHIIALFAYVAFAGASVIWAFKPEISFTRYVQQAMILASIILPAALAVRADLMRGLFLCFAFAAILNLLFALNNSSSVIATLGGYPGYFAGKNYLGEFSGILCLLALHEAYQRGARRVAGVVILSIAILLLFLSGSKTAIGLALLCPALSIITLSIRRVTRLSPAIILSCIPFLYFVATKVSSFTFERMGYLMYGDSTFTGRTIIWAFADREIAHRPFLGWGYQSFWLVGPDAPSIVNAPMWVKSMPNAHNGYYDTMIEMGYVGLFLLVIFIFATIHAVGRVADRDAARAWLVLSLLGYFIFYNFLESLWMHGFEMAWVMYLIVVADIARFWHSQPSVQVDRRVGKYVPDQAGRDRYRTYA